MVGLRQRFTDFSNITNYNDNDMIILSSTVFVIIMFSFKKLMTIISRDRATKVCI